MGEGGEGRVREEGRGERERGERGERGEREEREERERREREREAGMTWLPHRCHVDSPHCPRERDFFMEKKNFRLLCGHLKS